MHNDLLVVQARQFLGNVLQMSPREAAYFSKRIGILGVQFPAGRRHLQLTPFSSSTLLHRN